MHITPVEFLNQIINSEKFGVFGSYFSSLKIGSMLNKSGITKTKGASPLELFTIVFNLAFIGKNFFEGVVRNKKVASFSQSTSMPLLVKLLHHYVFDLIILFCFFLDIFVVRKPSFNYEFLIFPFHRVFFCKRIP